MPRTPLPLTGPPPVEVGLPQAPLARVLAQVRFAPILAILKPELMVDFQEAVRAVYPSLSEDQVHHIVLPGPGNAPEVRQERIWRFTDRASAPRWRLSVGVEFLALETTSYSSRADFIERLRCVFEALESAFHPGEILRLGVRYIDQLKDEAVDRLDDLIRPAVLGVFASRDGTRDRLGDAIIHALTEAQIAAAEGTIQARWGMLPANATYDPQTLVAVPAPTWIIDLDMFTNESLPFETITLTTLATQFTERVYGVFRDMVTDEFLRFYGGAVQ